MNSTVGCQGMNAVSDVEFITQQHGAYQLSDDPQRLDHAAIHAYLSRSYWAEGIPLATVERSLRNSLCIGVYDEAGAQVGLGRFVSDFATFCYVCDLYVLEEHRGRGISKAMMRMALDHPRLQGLRRWSLATRDAHGLYARFGFTSLVNPARHMERVGNQRPRG